MHLIKIDRSTIKKKEYPDLSSHISAGRSTVTIVFKGPFCIPALINYVVDLGFAMVRMSTMGDAPWTAEFTGISSTPYDAINAEIKKYPGVTWNYHEEVQFHRVEEIGFYRCPWTFSYENTPVQCRECSAVFGFQQLERADIEDEYDYDSSDEVCPKCGLWGCCDLDYEDINDVMNVWPKF